MALALGKRDPVKAGMKHGRLKRGSLTCARIAVKYGQTEQPRQQYHVEKNRLFRVFTEAFYVEKNGISVVPG